MPSKNKQKHPISFSKDLYDSFSGLGERGLMTPSHLSRLVMYAILPAKSGYLISKNMPLENDEQGFCSQASWSLRNSFNIEVIEAYYNFVTYKHTCKVLSIDGIETLEVLQKNLDSRQEYTIFCCGNGQDAMSIYSAARCIDTNVNKNYILWNYPGVGSSAGDSHSADDLFKAGYKQAKRLIDQGIPAKDITLHGLSLGGGVATHVARQLHEEGYSVNLEVDRSFSSLAAVIPAMTKKIKPKYAPLITSVIALGLSGVALGTTFAGFVASVGLESASATAAVGYIGAHFSLGIGLLLQETMRVIGEMVAFPVSFFSEKTSDDIKSFFNLVGEYLTYPFHLTAYAINEIISTIASIINSTVNLVGSIGGGLIAASGLIAGGLTGVVLGAFLSLQLLWTDKPLIVPLTFAFGAALYSACCEMDSVSEIKRLVVADEKCGNEAVRIEVINTVDDEIIQVDASLNTGLGFKPGKVPSDDVNKSLKRRVTSFWYGSGGHMGPLSDPVIPMYDDVDKDSGLAANLL